MDPFLGEIRMFAGTLQPRNWMFCDGRLLPISTNQALFALMGTTYGGDGVTTFAIPDLRGRVPIHAGQGPGLSNYVLGQRSGSESVTLLASQIPAHSHALLAQAAPATSADPFGRSLASAALDAYTSSGDALVAMHAQAIAANGGSQPHENMAPFIALNFIIATAGLFPSQP